MTPAPISVERLREAISDIQDDVLRGTLFADVAHKKLERLKAVVAQQHNEIADLRQRHHESLLAWEAETRRSSEQQERAEAAERAREEATGLLRRVNASLYLLDKPHREFGGVTDKTATDIAAFLAAIDAARAAVGEGER